MSLFHFETLQIKGILTWASSPYIYHKGIKTFQYEQSKNYIHIHWNDLIEIANQHSDEPYMKLFNVHKVDAIVALLKYVFVYCQFIVFKQHLDGKNYDTHSKFQFWS